MSGQMKVKSLSLSRKTQTPPRKEEFAKHISTEEEKAVNASDLEAILNSPIARPSRLCSTPIRRDVESIEDSPDVDYRYSPTLLFPCTQESNEVAWDWQSAANNTEESSGKDITNKNSPALNKTPKRRQPLFKKKRTAKAYSPLLNIPSKRKLVNVGVAESIGKFAAELKALADKINNEQQDSGDGIEEDIDEGEKTQRIKKPDSVQSNVFDMETQKPFDIHEATTLEVSYIVQEKSDPNKQDSSLDNLFDDDVDACMVQCSQEIEDKLKFNSGAARNKPVLNLSNEDKTKKNSSDLKTASRNIENKYEEIRREKSDPKTAQGLLEENDIPQSQIPDDSMDDCLALCLDDDTDLFSKFFEDEKTEGSSISKKIIDKSSERDDSGRSNSSDMNKSSLGKISKAHIDVSSNSKRKQEAMGPNNEAGNSESRKFFKTKSLSDSYCGNLNLGNNGKISMNVNSNLGRSYPPPITKSNSNFNLNIKTKANGIQSKVSLTPNLNNNNTAAGSRNNDSSDNSINKQVSNNKVSYSYLRSSSDNLERSSSDVESFKHNLKPLETPRSFVDSKNTMATNSQRYNPEEIERKRLEAKMKLEANKLKKQMNSYKSNNNLGLSLQNKRPVVKRETREKKKKRRGKN